MCVSLHSSSDISWNLDQPTNKYTSQKKKFWKTNIEAVKEFSKQSMINHGREIFGIFHFIDCRVFFVFFNFCGLAKISEIVFTLSLLLLLADWKMEMCRRRSNFSIFCFLYLSFLKNFMQFWKILKSRKTETIHEISACSWNAKNYFHNKQNRFFGVLESASMLQWISKIPANRKYLKSTTEEWERLFDIVARTELRLEK